MKFLHTGDLHIGKIVHEISMLEDQIAILEEIEQIAKEEKVDAVVIAGDIYDRAVPIKEAVVVFDRFLTKLSMQGILVLAIGGNHDSPERISFGSHLFEGKGVYLTGSFDGTLKKVSISDEYGEVDFYLFPFVKPERVQRLYEMPSLKSYQDLVNEVLLRTPLNPKNRSVLIAHQFVLNRGISPECSDSENSICVGGVDGVEAESFKNFDYVALGHIHKCQKIGDGFIYYSGSPLKYSFSEAYHNKGVFLVNIGKQKKEANSSISKLECEMTIEHRPLCPLHDMRKIRGSLKELLKEEIVQAGNKEDYLCVTLTDEEELIDPVQTLRSVYPNVMQLILEKNLDKRQGQAVETANIKEKTPVELFFEFFSQVRGTEPDEKRLDVIRTALEETEILL